MIIGDVDDRRYSTSTQRQRMLKMRQASIRVKLILQMQWHPVLIVVIIATYTIYLASVLMHQKRFSEYDQNIVRTWFACLTSANGNAENCLALAEGIGPSQSELLTAIIILALSGVPGVIICSRLRMFRGWIDYINAKREGNATGPSCQNMDINFAVYSNTPSSSRGDSSSYTTTARKGLL
ncbi:hypothetical protein BGW36DRAFT_367448 [Talaromyces proteolyticus]|uniref:Uncharacterized protein n=1 Tax=Talaromyces proteolyticus TaxID=1131652 RepID=A0AAD4L3T0_9EURO|nr:uncharacterized protein BGW36DRAFT_367448 [Talaromyces proteolyticus]KAH8705383.1 hypothetical protein BGW36DRAFT_367448 [Talaromyces proteolyticus]